MVVRINDSAAVFRSELWCFFFFSVWASTLSFQGKISFHFLPSKIAFLFTQMSSTMTVSMPSRRKKRKQSLLSSIDFQACRYHSWDRQGSEMAMIIGLVDLALKARWILSCNTEQCCIRYWEIFFNIPRTYRWSCRLTFSIRYWKWYWEYWGYWIPNAASIPKKHSHLVFCLLIYGICVYNTDVDF